MGVSPRDIVAASDGRQAVSGSSAQLLTPRERGIAQLIARGYSNRRIAEELVIAPSTAERHVANILAKLNLRSRTEVAMWAAEQRQPMTLPRLATDLTSFIGRERELAELERLLSTKR